MYVVYGRSEGSWDWFDRKWSIWLEKHMVFESLGTWGGQTEVWFDLVGKGGLDTSDRSYMMCGERF